MAQELVHKVKKHKGKGGLMLAKIDLSKAYDKLEWPFINMVLWSWDFSEPFRKLVYGCFNSVHFNLLINGNVVGDFSPTRGLRKGIPYFLPLYFMHGYFIPAVEG